MRYHLFRIELNAILRKRNWSRIYDKFNPSDFINNCSFDSSILLLFVYSFILNHILISKPICFKFQYQCRLFVTICSWLRVILNGFIFRLTRTQKKRLWTVLMIKCFDKSKNRHTHEIYFLFALQNELRFGVFLRAHLMSIKKLLIRNIEWVQFIYYVYGVLKCSNFFILPTLIYNNLWQGIKEPLRD